eukprot:TRINITY_DN14944_c0_g1_i1.p1 TRINITY_DN14944_c0_g1~~TRINITY_DN14944_c0_g1_i1.p1  ORF type:complete len:529 (-),score=114.76 TRINITY_DN14944_c0_g1_i1:148-1734(-)
MESRVGQALSLSRVRTVVAWYCLCSANLGLLNSAILRSLPYPATLAAWHMACTAALTMCALKAKPPPGPGVPGGGKPAPVSALQAAPIGMLFALALGIGGRSSLHLSLNMMDMLKAWHPVLVYGLSCAVGIDDFVAPRLQAVLVVVVGGGLTGFGREGSIGIVGQLSGVLFLLVGSIAECVRVVLVGRLVCEQRGEGLEPFQVLLRSTVIALPVLMVLAFVMEAPVITGSAWKVALFEEVGLLWLLGNGVFAFLLNAISIHLVQLTDPVFYVVIGSLKEVVAVTLSAIVLSAPVSSQQFCGYIVALVGIILYILVKRRPATFLGSGGMMGGVFEVAKELPEVIAAVSKNSEKERHRAARKALQAELDGELDRAIPMEMEKVAARALNIDIKEEDDLQPTTLGRGPALDSELRAELEVLIRADGNAVGSGAISSPFSPGTGSKTKPTDEEAMALLSDPVDVAACGEDASGVGDSASTFGSSAFAMPKEAGKAALSTEAPRTSDDKADDLFEIGDDDEDGQDLEEGTVFA